MTRFKWTSLAIRHVHATSAVIRFVVSPNHWEKWDSANVVLLDAKLRVRRIVCLPNSFGDTGMKTVTTCVVAILLILPLLAAPVAAQAQDDLQKLAKRLRANQLVTVTTLGGDSYTGTFKTATDTAVILDMPEVLPSHLVGAAAATRDQSIAFRDIRSLSYKGELTRISRKVWVIAGIAFHPRWNFGDTLEAISAAFQCLSTESSGSPHQTFPVGASTTRLCLGHW